MSASGLSRLRELARQSSAQRAAEQERCELCSEPIPPEHRHLLDLSRWELVCACRACAILFDRPQASEGQLRLVPDRRLLLDGFALDDVTWAELAIPVDMAFFLRDSGAERVACFYPSPVGATESLLELAAWEQLERDNTVLRTLEADVEALLVNRARGARQYFIVPIEDAYRLVALIRMRWRGFTGGREVWEGIEAFFEELTRKAKTVQSEERKVAWPT